MSSAALWSDKNRGKCVENQRSRELDPLNINGCFLSLHVPPPPHVFPLSLLPVPSSSSHTISHTDSCITCRLGVGPWSRGRPKKEDWQQKKDRYQRTPGRRRSQEDFRRLGELLKRARVTESHSHPHCHTLSLPLCHIIYLSHSLSHSVTRSQVAMPTEERRLAAEEGSLPKNTWSQKIARGCRGVGELL